MRFVRLLPGIAAREGSDHATAGSPEFVIGNLNELPQVLQDSESYENI
jgi:hypothetical protein